MKRPLIRIAASIAALTTLLTAAIPSSAIGDDADAPPSTTLTIAAQPGTSLDDDVFELYRVAERSGDGRVTVTPAASDAAASAARKTGIGNGEDPLSAAWKLRSTDSEATRGFVRELVAALRAEGTAPDAEARGEGDVQTQEGVYAVIDAPDGVMADLVESPGRVSFAGHPAAADGDISEETNNEKQEKDGEASIGSQDSPVEDDAGPSSPLIEPKPSASDDDHADTDAYIARHADRSLVGEGAFIPGDVMTVTRTQVYAASLDKPTLDRLWRDDDGDGTTDHVDAFAGQSSAPIMLYQTSDTARWLVGRAGTPITGASVTDWQAGRADMSGTLYKDIRYDQDSGLIYVPSSYRDKAKGFGSTRAQLLYELSERRGDATASSKVHVSVDATGVKGRIASGTGAASILEEETSIRLAQDATARHDIRTDTIDAVRVNGVDFDHESKVWSYDRGSGVLHVAVPSTAVTDVQVELSDTLGKKVARGLKGIGALVGAKRAEAYETLWVPNTSLWSFVGGKPRRGQSFDVDAVNHYKSRTEDTQAALGADGTVGVSGNTDEALKAMVRAIINRSPSFEAKGYGSVWGALYWITEPRGGWYGDVHVPALGRLALECSHLSVDNDFVERGWRGEPGAFNQRPDQSRRARFTVLDVGDSAGSNGHRGWITFGVVIPTANEQTGVAMFSAHWQLQGRLDVSTKMTDPKNLNADPKTPLSDTLTITGTMGLPGGLSMDACTTLHYDSNSGERHTLPERCRTVTTRQPAGGRDDGTSPDKNGIQVTPEAYRPSNIHGWTYWHEGHYWFDARVHIHGGDQAALFSNADAHHAGLNDANEETNRLSVTTQATGDGRWDPAGPVKDTLTVKGMGRLPRPIAIRTFLYVDTDGKADAQNRRGDLMIDTDTTKGDPDIGDKWLSDFPSGKATSPAYTPDMLKRRDGTDANLTTWPAGHYWFDTKVAFEHGQGGVYMHADKYGDPTESWDRTTTGHSVAVSTVRQNPDQGAKPLGPHQRMRDKVTVRNTGRTALPGGSGVTAKVTLNGAGKKTTKTATLALAGGLGVGAKADLHSDWFSPSDLPGESAWRTNTTYWFDATVTVTIPGHKSVTVSHAGRDDPAERFAVDDADLDLGASTQAARGSADATNGSPVSDTLTLSGLEGLTSVRVGRVGFTLNYHPDRYGDPGDGRTKRVTKNSGPASVSAAEPSITSQRFTPADLFGKDRTRWEPGCYWFDVAVKGADVTATKDGWPATARTDIVHGGSQDGRERFRIDEVRDVDVVLHARKHWKKGASKRNITDFKARLHLNMDASGEPYDVKGFSSDGVADFKAVRYTLDDLGRTFRYTITEEGAGTTADGITYDGTRHQVSVSVTARDGRLVATPDYGDDADAAEFTNEYKPQPTTAQIEASKLFEGDALSRADITSFTFELHEGKDGTGPVIQTKHVDAAGVKSHAAGTSAPVRFDPITYTRAGTYEYTVTERAGAAGGVTYDGRTLRFSIPVTDDGAGHLRAPERPVTPAGQTARFENVYKPRPTSVVLRARKALEDEHRRKLAVQEGRYAFDLRAADGEVLQTKTNGADGWATFDPIEFDAEDMGGGSSLEREYAIVERKGDDQRIRYDTRPRTVRVSVRDDGEGSLVATVSYEGGTTPPTVTNVIRTASMLPITGGDDAIGPALLAGGVTLGMLIIGMIAVALDHRRRARP